MKKASNPLPEGIERPPAPPSPPPMRTFKETFLYGLIETEESKLRRRDYDNYMRGYRDALGWEEPDNE
jgi:hypothetical protein